MKEKSSLPTYLLEHTPWENEINPIWQASCFVLRRNLAKTLFPGAQDETHSGHLLEILKNTLLQCPELKEPMALKAETLSPLDKEYLFEHFFGSDTFQNTQKGQAFVIDQSARFLATLNIQDHVQLQLVDCGGAWEQTWNRLTALETALAQSFEYAYSTRFGYLTSNPALCGTGLTVYIYLHLPALIHTGQLEDTVIKQKEESVSIQDLPGDMLILSNTHTLGLSEDAILHALNATAMKLIVAEKTIRNQLQKENSADIKDQISRAYGLLTHSYQLQTKEALSALSLIKLGIDLGWITGISDQKINVAFFQCRRAHLTQTIEEDHADLARHRATYLHRQLAGMQLKIES